MRSNNSLLLRFGEHIHGSLETFRPVGLGQAVHQADVDVIGVQFAAEALEISPRRGGIARPCLRQNRHFVPWHVLQRLRDMWMAAVRIGAVKESQALVISVAK